MAGSIAAPGGANVADGARPAPTRDEVRFALARRVSTTLASVAFIAVGYVIVHSVALRGAWVLDPSGIEFQPLRGSSRSVKWSQVEAIRTPWSANMLFRGGGVSIPLTLIYVEKDDHRRIRAALETWLGSAFDLAFHSQPMTRGGRVRLLAITGLLTLCLWAAAAYVAYDDPYEERRWLAAAILLLVLALPLSVFLIDRWLNPQAHCSWRYRMPPLDEPQTDECL
jgi:hypothetical protein